MKYELLNNGRGILVDRAPILCDVNDTLKVSFLLPDNAQYVAILIDIQNVKRQLKICDNEIVIPKDLLRPQYVKVYVVKIENDKIIMSWDCEPIKISNLGDMLKSQWEISGGLTETAAVERIVELERSLNDANMMLASQNAQIEQLTNSYNNAIKVINNISERVDALEANYDPTVIGEPPATQKQGE